MKGYIKHFLCTTFCSIALFGGFVAFSSRATNDEMVNSSVIHTVGISSKAPDSSTSTLEASIVQTKGATTTINIATSTTSIKQSTMYEIPDEASSFKTYMDYRCITNTLSRQYKLQKQAHTDENGIRKVGDYFCVALGSYYGIEIGAHYRVCMESGKSFLAVLADQKSDSDTNAKNQYSIYNNDVIEFVVDTKELVEVVKTSGNVGSLPLFSGDIKYIEKI